jgi:hypothetical protein
LIGQYDVQLQDLLGVVSLQIYRDGVLIHGNIFSDHGKKILLQLGKIGGLVPFGPFMGHENL